MCIFRFSCTMGTKVIRIQNEILSNWSNPQYFWFYMLLIGFNWCLEFKSNHIVHKIWLEWILNIANFLKSCYFGHKIANFMQVSNFRHTRPTWNTLLQPKNYLYGCYKAVKWCDTILIPFYLVSVPYRLRELLDFQKFSFR